MLVGRRRWRGAYGRHAWDTIGTAAVAEEKPIAGSSFRKSAKASAFAMGIGETSFTLD